jgi:hypothetical protein
MSTLRQLRNLWVLWVTTMVLVCFSDAGKIHAFVATPVNASIGESVADVARTHPQITLPTNVGKQLLPGFRLGRIER